MGHLNGILAQVGGNLNNNFQKSQMSGGMLKLRFDQYIMGQSHDDVIFLQLPESFRLLFSSAN